MKSNFICNWLNMLRASDWPQSSIIITKAKSVHKKTQQHIYHTRSTLASHLISTYRESGVVMLWWSKHCIFHQCQILVSDRRLETGRSAWLHNCTIMTRWNVFMYADLLLVLRYVLLNQMLFAWVQFPFSKSDNWCFWWTLEKVLLIKWLI